MTRTTSQSERTRVPPVTDAEVAARLAEHGRGLTGDGALVDGGHAFDDFAIGRNGLLGFDQEAVAPAQAVCRDDVEATGTATVLEALCLDFATRRTQRRSLRLATALGHGLGEVREQHREPQPGSYGEHEPRLPEITPDADGGHETENRRQQAGDVHHEHHGISDLYARVELAQSIHDPAADDRTAQDAETIGGGTRHGGAFRAGSAAGARRLARGRAPGRT